MSGIYWSQEHTETLPSGIVIDLSISPDDVSPEGQFASGDDEADRAMVKDIYRQIDQGNTWAWCNVRVRATFAGFMGEDYLGCCSYRDVGEFIRPGDYYTDMVAQAVADLMATIERESKPNPLAVAALATLTARKGGA